MLRSGSEAIFNISNKKKKKLEASSGMKVACLDLSFGVKPDGKTTGVRSKVLQVLSSDLRVLLKGVDLLSDVTLCVCVCVRPAQSSRAAPLKGDPGCRRLTENKRRPRGEDDVYRRSRHAWMLTGRPLLLDRLRTDEHAWSQVSRCSLRRRKSGFFVGAEPFKSAK